MVCALLFGVPFEKSVIVYQSNLSLQAQYQDKTTKDSRYPTSYNFKLLLGTGHWAIAIENSIYNKPGKGTVNFFVCVIFQETLNTAQQEARMTKDF